MTTPPNPDPVSAEAISAGLNFCCGKYERAVLEIAALRNVVQAGMTANCPEVFKAWNYHFPDRQIEPYKKVEPQKVSSDGQ